MPTRHTRFFHHVRVGVYLPGITACRGLPNRVQVFGDLEQTIRIGLCLADLYKSLKVRSAVEEVGHNLDGRSNSVDLGCRLVWWCIQGESEVC